MKCNRCGAEIPENENFCTVCGEPREGIRNEFKEIEEVGEKELKKENKEMTCLVLGILSFFSIGLGTIFGIIAIVLGSKIQKETNKKPAGMICGIISLSIQALILLVIGSIYIVAAILGVK